jgi:hypothetical protein
MCHGAVVIAFERTRIVKGIEKPDTSSAKEIVDESLPTPWNQLEAAMAYARNVPLLTFIQSGLKRQGMLSDRFEWMAIETDLSPALLSSEQFRQVFSEWLSLVQRGAQEHKAKHEESSGQSDLERSKLLPLLRSLTVKQACGMVAALFAIAASIATGAFRVGQLFARPEATVAEHALTTDQRRKAAAAALDAALSQGQIWLYSETLPPAWQIEAWIKGAAVTAEKFQDILPAGFARELERWRQAAAQSPDDQRAAIIKAVNLYLAQVRSSLL